MKELIVTIALLLHVLFVSGQEKELWWDKNESGKFGVVEFKTKKVVVDYKYDDVKFLARTSDTHVSPFKTKLNGKLGLIDKFGKEVIEPKYDEIKFFTQSSDWIETKLDGKFGFMKISMKGNITEVFPPKYDEYFYPGGESFPSGFVNVRLGKKWGLVDELTGKEITKMKYDEVSSDFYNSNLASVKLNNKWGYIDKTGKEVISCKFDKVGHYSEEEDKAEVTLNGKTFYINKLGKEVK